MILKRLALLGLLFFLLSLLLGFFTLYYRGSLSRLEREVIVSLGEPIYWPFNPPTSPRIYYNVTCSSSTPFSVRMDFLDENDVPLDSLNINGYDSSSVHGEELLNSSSYRAILNLTRGKRAECRIQLFYYSANTSIMVFLLALQIITSLVAVALSIIWFSKKITGSQPEAGNEGKTETLF